MNEMVILVFFAKFRIGFMVILDKSTYRIVIKLLKQTDNTGSVHLILTKIFVLGKNIITTK